jgi:hypothetical protein
MRRAPHTPATAAVALLLLLSGCAAPRALLDPRPAVAADDPQAALIEQYNALADRLQATATYYDHEADKSHLKMRAMSVLVGVSAAGAGGTIGALAQPDFPDAARPGLASFGVSLAVLAGLFAVLPHAHQYILKEATYADRAEETRSAYEAIEARCGPTLPGRPEAEIGACVAELQRALAEARAFDRGGPGKPPAEAELDQLLRRSR